MDQEWSQLRQALALSGRRRLPVFFRDDDAADDIPPLRRLLTLFETRRVPLNLEIIPGRLTDDGTGLLRDAASRHPDLIGLNQHGWRHENHERSGKKAEFGPSRDADKQAQDIRAGRQRLEEAFGHFFFPVFTPPWNRYSPATCQILTSLGFTAISDFGRPDRPALNGIIQLPATIDIIDWRGSRDLRPVDELLAQLAVQLTSVGVIGILLHHQVMGDPAFEFLARLLDILIESENVSLHRFQSLLRSEQ
ncbi:MAG: hypothetical protein RIR52_64 [Acidobacteriota bacterium]|jgi:hypothetical protein